MPSIIRLIKNTYHMAGAQESKLVIHNAALLSGLQAITYILPIIILPYLFRVIGPEKFGLIAFAQAFAQYFMIITDYGFSITATKEISICQNEHAKICEVFSSVMLVKLGLAFVSFFILMAVVYFIPKFQEDPLVYILSFGIVAGSSLFPVWFFQGMEKMKYIVFLNIFGELLYVVCIFVFVRTREDYLMVPLTTSLVSLTIGLLGLYIVFRRFKVMFKFPGYSSMKQQIKAGWNLFISIVAINAYTTTRIFAVGLLTNNTTTGFYSMAEKIANVAQTFPLSAFSQAIFPRMSHIFHRNKLKAFNMMQHIQLITISISLIFLPIIFILAPAIVHLVCGGIYPEVTLSLRLLIVSVFFISSNAFRVQFLLVCGRMKTYSKIHISMALIGLPLILILISIFSYVGAAMATVIIECGIFTITYITIKKLNLHQPPREP
jgi:PST family polysaccharide transporter